MTLFDLRYLFTDDSQLIKIYGNVSETVIYEGEFCNLPSHLEGYEVMSIDTIYEFDFDGYITINIER